MAETYMVRPVPIKRPTLLYGIEPRGAGTSEVESLYSLLLRLAHAHSLPPNKLVNLTMASDPQVNALLTAEGRTQEIARNFEAYGWGWGWGWDKHAGKTLIGTGPSAARWAKAISHATGIPDLWQCTLRCLSEMITDTALVTEDERVCLDCLKEDIKRGDQPYERLIWRLQHVKCCVRHKKPLVAAKCGRPDSEAQDPYLRVKHPGVCSGCGSIGYKCLGRPNGRVLPEELWRAEQCADLIAQRAMVSRQCTYFMKMHFSQRFARQLGGMAALAERAGSSKSALSSWLSGETKRTSLGLLLDIAAVESVSLVSIFSHQWLPVPTPEEAQTPMREPKSTHSVPHATIREVMAKAVKEGRTASEVAKQLGVDLSTLRQHEDLYFQLRKGLIDRQQQDDDRRRQAAVEDARQVAKRLLDRGKTISLSNASALTKAKWYPSQLRAQALVVIRHTLATGSPPKGIRMGAKTVGEAAEAAYQLLRERSLRAA